ncbi:hypothetical protein BU24DRAFT_454413 [Aaosphaeria arxii CBS 175.79]|uniref:Uncharacterized protein n=1 Tax=Aaosphaeria arxii CBS 175.79 TaxID=1450172 RepID=A0A6A5XDH6_9PLEO|nr:uncharacterized protein BU24DRAFT_454413 [Aaosphaeria arxii CBS 175.79]KAF2010866.1 hypothetical protein BU24DRAFT_454413 [Aaosphaeria arxii CBS 175.79]
MSRKSAGASPGSQDRRRSSGKSRNDGEQLAFDFPNFNDSEWIQNLQPVGEYNFNFMDNAAVPSNAQSGFGLDPRSLDNSCTIDPALDAPAPYQVDFQSSGIAPDTFYGLDDSTQQASMRLLARSNAAVPSDPEKAYEVAPRPSNADPTPVLYRYSLMPGYNNFGPYDDCAVQQHDIRDNSNNHTAYQQPAIPVTALDTRKRRWSSSVASRNNDGKCKRPRVNFVDSDSQDNHPNSPRRSPRHAHGSSGHNSTGKSSLVSYDPQSRMGPSPEASHRSADVDDRDSLNVVYKPEKPQLDDDKKWVRINKATKGRSTRTGKINNYKPEYPSQEHPVGDWQGISTKFKYNDFGELKAFTLTARQMNDFILNYPTDKSKGRKLILWIQKTPADSARRYSTSTWSTCRFAACPARDRDLADKPTGAILHGHYRVAFDEKWYKYSHESNPYLVSFYVHLDCMERFLDLPFLVASPNVDIKPDTRAFSMEMCGRWAASLDHGPELPITKAFLRACKNGRLHTLPEFQNYPLHDPDRRGERQEKQLEENYLTYWMNHHKLLRRPPAQHEEFGKKIKCSNVVLHHGNLEIYHAETTHAIRLGYKTKNARKDYIKEMAAKYDNSFDGFRERVKEYHNKELLLRRVDILEPIYEAKMRIRRPKYKGFTPKRILAKSLMPQSEGPSEEPTPAKTNGSNRRNIEEEDSDDDINDHYDPTKWEYDGESDDDNVGDGLNSTQHGTQASRRSARVQEFKATGKYPKTYAEPDDFLAADDEAPLLPLVSQVEDFTQVLPAVMAQPNYQYQQQYPQDGQYNQYTQYTQYVPAIENNADQGAFGLNNTDNTGADILHMGDEEFEAFMNLADPAVFNEDFLRTLEVRPEDFTVQGVADDSAQFQARLLRRRSTMRLLSINRERIASALRLSSTTSRKGLSVSFADKEPETQTFDKSQPPREVGHPRRQLRRASKVSPKGT